MKTSLEKKMNQHKKAVEQQLQKYLCKDTLTVEELESASILYSSNDYKEFIITFDSQLRKLNPAERFMLFKRLYISADGGNEFLAESLQLEVYRNGVPSIEIENIKKNVAFTNGFVRVFRGLNVYNSEEGTSFTLDKDKAIWFSKRFGENVRLLELDIRLEDIIFYDNSREEQEVFLKDEVVEEML